MTLKIYNSLTRQKEDFVPISGGKDVLMYVCGPTVYALSHIGHARSAVAFDVIYRFLLHSGYKVKYARNYTDVDDKIINRANEEGVDSKELAERFILAFDADMDALGVALPDVRPKATETIAKIIELTELLIAKKYAYQSNGDVFYSVRLKKDYGKLSGKNIDELESGSRVDVNEDKKDPLDFALWKAGKPGEPAWESPWGPGRPGWHIECSAMCLSHLGERIDIHGGGRDLIFPHHENEIAQSEAITGQTPFAKYWLHNGFVNIEKEKGDIPLKMSKSVGNVLNIRDVLKDHDAEAVRLFLLGSHYRSPIDYTKDSIKEAEAGLERFYKTLLRIEEGWQDAGDVVILSEKQILRGVYTERSECAQNDNTEHGKNGLRRHPERSEGSASSCRAVFDAMDDDFNTAGVIGAVFKEINRANKLMDNVGPVTPAGVGLETIAELRAIYALCKEASSFLGVFGSKPEEFFKRRKTQAGVAPVEIEGLIEERNAARRDKDFKKADAIRARLLEKGIVLEDAPKGTTWGVKKE